MKIYFLSSRPCELTLNGVFFGVTDSFERFAHVNLSDRIYANFSPQNALSIGVFLDDELIHAPPKGVEVYILQDGIAVYAKDFPPSDYVLRPIAQRRFENDLITVFSQGEIHLSIETEKGFFITPLPPAFSECTISKYADLFFIEGKNQLALYTKEGNCVFMEKILTYNVQENTLNATLPLSDSLCRTAECSWTLHKNGCTQTKFLLRQKGVSTPQEEEQPIHVRKEDLLAYAFFESVLIGADFTPFLCEELQENKEELRSFLGEFVGVSLTPAPHVCGLIRKKAERVFEVQYYRIIIENGKIIDVKSDFFNKIP